MFALAIQGIVALVVCWVVYSAIVFFQNQRRLSRFPGPLSYPIIGSLWDWRFLMLYKHMSTMRKKYGKLVLFYTFSRPNLLICDPVIARRILSDSKTFYKGADYTEYFARAFGKGLVTSNGEDHRKGKAALGKYFIRSSVVPYTPAFNQITCTMISQYLEPSFTAEEKEKRVGKAFNMEIFFARLALRSFMRFSCAVDCSNDPHFEEELCHEVSKGSFSVAISLITRQPNSKWFPAANAVLKTIDMVGKYFEKCVAERRARIAAGERFDDMLQVLIEDPTMTQKEREDHFMTIIAAGHDTTAFFMSYLVYLLARNPHIQDKLRQHIEEVLGPAPAEGEGEQRDVTADDVAQLKYLHCVMMETLRLYPVIPNVTRECAEDVHIKDDDVDVVIPKNCNLFIPMIVMNKDPEMWEDPETFNPDRFANKPSADYTSAKQGFFPFAFGSRICVGNTLAQIESGIAIVHLLRRFSLSEVVGFRPKIRGGISLTTTNGMQITVTPL